MHEITKEEQIERFRAFDMACRELNDMWLGMEPNTFSEDYPFEIMFCELQEDVARWSDRTIARIEKKLKHDLKINALLKK